MWRAPYNQQSIEKLKMKNARWFVESPKPRARHKFARFPPIPIAANSACQKRRGLPHIRRRLFADGYISKYWLPRNDKHNLQLPSRLSVANAHYAGLFFFLDFREELSSFLTICAPRCRSPPGEIYRHRLVCRVGCQPLVVSVVTDAWCWTE